MAANVCASGRHLIDDGHRRRGPHRKCRQNVGQLPFRIISIIGSREIKGESNERRTV